MSDLLRAQQAFALMVPRLILHAAALGYGVTLGDAYRDPRCGYGHPLSLHRSRLALDLNLFTAEGKYLDQGADATEAHRRLHNFWASIGGAQIIPTDLNHYSYPYGGMT